jgi:phosphoribosylformylglycinamidine cyclo-ligase
VSAKQSKSPLTYERAGVSIDRGNRLVEHIKILAHRTRRAGVLGDIGGFGALFDLGALGYRDPLLVAGTDGVGTKIKLAIETGRHDGIGIDLVAMCANDLVVQGAEPLFFLDYFACGRLEVDVAERVIAGIARGCEEAGAALIGGETAEMPGMYADGDYDLAGFCVGAVERDSLIDGRRVRAGDQLIGIASSGPHSNGYSLIRRILADHRADLDLLLDGTRLEDILLAPTRIYVRPVLALVRRQPVHAIAHITGGGLIENLPRVIPAELAARINTTSWEWPVVFRWLKEQGRIEDREMCRVFNCGVGMVVCVPATSARAAIDGLEQAGERAWVLGEIVPGAGDERVILSGVQS